MNKPEFNPAPIYRCTICETEYPTVEAARACYDSTPQPRFEVGDIVTFPGELYRWNDGLDHWVIGGEGRAHVTADSKPLLFYYVVTSVDVGNTRQSQHDRHRPLYSVKTRAMENGMKGGRGGWNSIVGHLRMELVDNPPAQVVEESKAFIGEIYTNLI